MKIILTIICFIPFIGNAKVHKVWVGDTNKIATYVKEDTTYTLKIKKDGHWMLFYDELLTNLCEEFHVKNGKISGVHKKYFRNGNLKSERHMHFHYGSIIYYEYYESGGLKLTVTNIEGTPMITTEYFRSKEISSIDTGSEKITYYENGKVKSFCRNQYKPFSREDKNQPENIVLEIKALKYIGKDCSFYDENGNHLYETHENK
ncbi:MAG: hypothetical protein HYY40_14010 [Bacteroidetes bacterium]|nr:hypothetical protein [Bacteroidota bacterium]